MPTFKLVDQDGRWLTDARLSVHTWKAGDRIPRGWDSLVVVEVRDEPDPTTLVVKRG